MKQKLLSGLVAAAVLGSMALPAAAQNLAVVNGKPVPTERAEILKQQVERSGRAITAGMLTGLAIRDVVLIEALDLEFGPGLGVLTGETGAGKSILLDALGLALGVRADTGLVRQGAAQASVAATFELPADHAALALLAENDLSIEPGEPLVIRRSVRADGGSRAFVNDQPASAGLLRMLGGALVEIHGQHDDRGLLNARGHRALLDAFGRIDSAHAARAHARWRAAEDALAEASADLDNAARDRPPLDIGSATD